MRTNDDKILEEMYTEGMFRRAKIKGKTLGATIQNKAVGGLGKLISGKDREGQMIKAASSVGKLDIEEKKADLLLKDFISELKKLNTELNTDAQKLGIDLAKIAQSDFQKQGQYPKLQGLSKFLKALNDTLRVS